MMTRNQGVSGKKFIPMFIIGTIIFMAIGFALTWMFGQMMGGPGPGSGISKPKEAAEATP